MSFRGGATARRFIGCLRSHIALPINTTGHLEIMKGFLRKAAAFHVLLINKAGGIRRPREGNIVASMTTFHSQLPSITCQYQTGRYTEDT